MTSTFMSITTVQQTLSTVHHTTTSASEAPTWELQNYYQFLLMMMTMSPSTAIVFIVCELTTHID